MSNQFSGSDLTLFRGDRCLFRGIGFEVESGELLVLEGSNGSGKTSLMKAIVGMLELECGILKWNDRPVTEQRQEFHGSLVWLAHRVGLKADLTLVENLRFESALRPQASDDMEPVLERLGLTRLKPLPLRSLSAGQQRRVALARILLADVPLWLMDEPFTNLDRAGRGLVLRLVNDHLETGGMCIMAAHQDIEIDAPMKKVTL